MESLTLPFRTCGKFCNRGKVPLIPYLRYLGKLITLLDARIAARCPVVPCRSGARGFGQGRCETTCRLQGVESRWLGRSDWLLGTLRGMFWFLVLAVACLGARPSRTVGYLVTGIKAPAGRRPPALYPSPARFMATDRSPHSLGTGYNLASICPFSALSSLRFYASLHIRKPSCAICNIFALRSGVDSEPRTVPTTRCPL